MPAATRPSLALFTSEPLRAAGDLLGHLRRRRGSDRPQRGDGHAVVLFPGLATDGMSLWPLRRYLAGLGYHALDWGQGFNTRPRGEVDSWLAALADSVLSTAQAQPAHAGRVSLIGWSLGGLYAREIAKLAPDRVRRVITIGTPFNGTTQQTNVAGCFACSTATRRSIQRSCASGWLRRRRCPRRPFTAAATAWWPGRPAGMDATRASASMTYDDAPALVVLQVALAVMNIRGARKVRREQQAAEKDVPGMPVAAGSTAQPKEQSR